jgi:hypothetical protein
MFDFDSDELSNITLIEISQKKIFVRLFPFSTAFQKIVEQNNNRTKSGKGLCSTNFNFDDNTIYCRT